ncbi:MAG TPA: lytic murein transglycosylase [Methylotenera sp.]|nr:lytic murein transglycosylase [Methylotenera sp.]
MVNKTLASLVLFLLCLFSLNVAFAQDDFNVWLYELKQEALIAGISEKTAAATINHVELLPNIIKLDRAQPEFMSTFFDYYHQRVGVVKIARGRALLAQYEPLLSQIEAQYGVPKALLVSFWAMETNYGIYQGNIDTLSTLATLAYDGRRAFFFRNQLLDAMRMVDAGHADIDEFRGSWAGAFGNMQFMPSTFITYAVDGDGDERIDIVNSVADAFASAANYLSQVGWREGEPVMIEVQLPENFQWQDAQLSLRKSTKEWALQGVTSLQASKVGEIKAQPNSVIAKSNQSAKAAKLNTAGKRKASSKTKNKVITKSLITNPLNLNASIKTSPKILVTPLPSTSSQAAILLPQGWRGPAFMVFDNFDAIMDWNRSVNYALSVAQLAKRIEGESPIFGGQFAETGALTFQEMYEVQATLNQRGFDAGEPDGFPGLQTQAAVRAFQQSQYLPADGYASPNLYSRLQAAQ